MISNGVVVKGYLYYISLWRWLSSVRNLAFLVGKNHCSDIWTKWFWGIVFSLTLSINVTSSIKCGLLLLKLSVMISDTNGLERQIRKSLHPIILRPVLLISEQNVWTMDMEHLAINTWHATFNIFDINRIDTQSDSCNINYIYYKSENLLLLPRI